MAEATAQRAVDARAAIEVEHLCFDYGRERALDDISFCLTTGSVTALVGPNGAGKTTLMRCIAALQRPLAGRITLCGTDALEEPRASHRYLGYLSDFFGLYESLSVRQCLTHAAATQTVSEERIPEAVTRTIADLELDAHADKAVSALSRGLRQRVGIGQAIIHGPAVLLLDEPASGLDPEARADLAGLFNRLAADGMTLLVSSHILAELEAYCTDMLILDGGRLIEHRPLTQPHDSDLTSPWTVTLARHDPHFAGLLDVDPQITAVHADNGTTWTVELPNAAEARAEILARWVQAGMPIAALAPQHADLQASYVARVRAARNGSAHGESS